MTVRATTRSRRAPGCSRPQNPHAAVIALERARDLEPDKGSVRETLARAYFRTRPLPGRPRRSSSGRSRSTR